jgi:hypothetical protein
MPSTSSPPTPPTQAVKTVKTITAQYISKATHYTKWERAHDAALWLRGELRIVPTTKLATRFFGVSAPLVVEAGRRYDEWRNNGVNGNGTPTLSDAVLDHMIIEIGPDRILAALDRVTQPTLPLQAAE